MRDLAEQPVLWNAGVLSNACAWSIGALGNIIASNARRRNRHASMIATPMRADLLREVPNPVNALFSTKSSASHAKGGPRGSTSALSLDSSYQG